ncbi:MAG: hypothetical protein QOE22_291 [Candidatus Parcubacteria bacterium]|jgi:uncharacterized membrane protein YjjB (DUF3815 family)|nr:hypothetical protein [Candidatus Parcubacteria bacterium]
MDTPIAQRNGLTLAIYWGIRAWLVVAVLLFMWRGDIASAGSTVLILFAILLPSLLKRKYRFFYPFFFDLSVGLFVFFTAFLGEVARFYDRIPFWDTLLHFQSGLLFGMAGYLLAYFLNEHKQYGLQLSPIFISLFAVSFAIAIGALWEIWEFVGDQIFGSAWAESLEDTVVDLVADSVGALLISVVGFLWMHRYKRLPMAPWLKVLKRKRRS